MHIASSLQNNKSINYCGGQQTGITGVQINLKDMFSTCSRVRDTDYRTLRKASVREGGSQFLSPAEFCVHNPVCSVSLPLDATVRTRFYCSLFKAADNCQNQVNRPPVQYRWALEPPGPISREITRLLSFHNNCCDCLSCLTCLFFFCYCLGLWKSLLVWKVTAKSSLSMYMAYCSCR